MNFREQIQQQTLTEIQGMENKSLEDVENNDNRLKTAYALTLRIEAASDKLKLISIDDLTKEMQQKMVQAIETADKLKSSYRERLDLDIDIFETLADFNNSRDVELRDQIDKLLKEFEARLRSLVIAREKLSLEEVVKNQNNE
jgi:hypothetical protein